MGRINILTSDIYNKISAGEVIENPASVVKELVENSIDAGASKVDITIRGGGIAFIEVTDNGCGIAEDDVDIAFIKHSTSKLSAAADLEHIDSLGFRGEALASISAVSKLKMTTKTPYSDTALTVEVSDGQIVTKNYGAGNVGTKITVEDLFYNTPARKKFLKSDSREAGEITQYITRLILTNPLLEVKYTLNNSEVYNFKGTGIEEAIYCVYDADCLKNCIPVNSKYKNIVVNGYIGSPEYTKANSTYQTISVNGRYVKDLTITTAVKQAFAPYLMTRNYPFFVLYISLPSNELDVNVHPQKMQVRFADARSLFVAVNLPIKDSLKKFTQNRVDEILTVKSGESLIEIPPTAAPTNILPDLTDSNFIGKNSVTNESQDREVYERIMRENNQRRYEQYLKEIDKVTVAQAIADMPIGLRSAFNQSLIPSTSRLPEEDKPKNEQQSFIQDDKSDFSKVKILGVAFDTYLILEIEDKIIFVDQHAAHERLLFDKFMTQIGNLHMQPMMFPYVFSVKDDENEFIENNLDEIRTAGFEIEQFGDKTYRISAIALMYTDMRIDNFVENLLASIDDFKLDGKQLIVEKIAKKACRAAVKGGDILNSDQIEYIVKNIYENKVLQCPHGRPITAVFTKTQLEKMFKRIV
ncbi:MAG: DNA mismatch repair endonuclease MutL [Corallococcus sp.]|nr:DNA mismatch repair endonuclease MutL [Corallococcus sp.]